MTTEALDSRWPAPPAAATRSRRLARQLRLPGLLAPPPLLLLVLFVYPLAQMASLSVRSKFPGAYTLTAAHYAQFVTHPYFLLVTRTTFLLAMTVTVLTIVIGYPVAYYFVRARSRHKHWIF